MMLICEAGDFLVASRWVNVDTALNTEWRQATLAWHSYSGGSPVVCRLAPNLEETYFWKCSQLETVELGSKVFKRRPIVYFGISLPATWSDPKRHLLDWLARSSVASQTPLSILFPGEWSGRWGYRWRRRWRWWSCSRSQLSCPFSPRPCCPVPPFLKRTRVEKQDGISGQTNPLKKSTTWNKISSMIRWQIYDWDGDFFSRFFFFTCY